MSSPENKKAMTWCLNTMLNGQHGAFIDKETASCALVPCILAAGSDLMERHKLVKVGK